MLIELVRRKRPFASRMLIVSFSRVVGMVLQGLLDGRRLRQPRQKVPLDSGSCYSVAENRIPKLVFRSVERMLRCTTNKFFLQVPAEAFSRSGTRRVNTGPTNRLDSWMQMPIRNVLHFEPVYELSYDAFPRLFIPRIPRYQG